ncbi:hypothetical protein N0V93_002921 [Gnomoniopsis smithogilvyi]|uniref:Uncharacterized protein n=1 Tax=Gnomoniopsis smithogilvyi TaxID=1191159 RepID=A0A9W8YXN3_9PEZI|nr:hypothetical protein N0V93_002921 [Gnomoniopsis smithogilvyi]
MTTTAVHSGQVTVTVTSAPDGTGAGAAGATSSSTLSLIYIYSTSTSAQPTEASSSTHTNDATRVSSGVIAGIVVSCIAFLVLMSLALFCYSRKVARRRRAEMASMRQSSRPAPSRAYSRATMGQGAMEEHKPNRSSHYTRSIGAISAETGFETMGTMPRSLKSPSPMPSRPPPAELPTPHNAKNVRVVNMRKPKPGVAEMYGSYAHPIELQAGSTTNLVTIKSGEKRMKASGSEGTGSHRNRRDSDVESRGYMSPEPEWHSSGRRGSDGAETEYGTDYGTGDGASIHIYYRSSAATIAQAMSQASLTNAMSMKASTRTSSTPFMSQTSLTDTAR